MKKPPVIIYLHGYAYSTGIMNTGNIITQFVNAGYAVYLYDQIGFGTRNTEESKFFYERFPTGLKWDAWWPMSVGLLMRCQNSN